MDLKLSKYSNIDNLSESETRSLHKFTENLRKINFEKYEIVSDEEAFPQSNNDNNAVVVKSLIWQIKYDVLYKNQFLVQDSELRVCTVLDRIEKVNKKSFVNSLEKYLAGSIYGVNKFEDEENIYNINELTIRFSRVSLCNAQLAEQVSGFAIGTIGPIGHDECIPVFVDNLLDPKIKMDLGPANGITDKVFYGGCGVREFSIALCYSDLLSCNFVQPAPLSSSLLTNDKLNKENVRKNHVKMHKNQISETTIEEQLWSAVTKPGMESEVQRLLQLLCEEGKDLSQIQWHEVIKSNKLGRKTLLHRAAWKGDLEVVELLLNSNVALDEISTGVGNYGKSAIFYAITQDRSDVVKLLLERGCDVLIVNNKGQSVVSLAQSRLQEDVLKMLHEVELQQISSGRKFVNYRASHSDEEKYGDLDPRFPIDKNNFDEKITADIRQYRSIYGDGTYPRSVMKTTPEIRREKFMKRWAEASSSKRMKESPVSEESKSPIERLEGIKGKANQYVGELEVLDVSALEKMRLLDTGVDCRDYKVDIVNDLAGIYRLRDSIEYTKKYLDEQINGDRFSKKTFLHTSWGCDCEWQPEDWEGEKNPVSTLQLSTKEFVFIVDMLTLCNGMISPLAALSTEEEELSSALTLLFATAEIPKIGFDFGQDMEKLCVSYPHLPCFKLFENIINIQELSRKAYPHLPKNKLASLQKTVAYVLNKQLDKSQQCSAWAQRPLAEEQIEYAATDAGVLRKLLEVMFGRIDKGVGENSRTSWRFKIMIDLLHMENISNIYQVKGGKIRRTHNVVVAKQTWLTTKKAPAPPVKLDTLPKRNKPLKQTKSLKNLPLSAIDLKPGTLVGLSKEDCIRSVLEDVPDPAKFILDFDRRHDAVIVKDAILLFIKADKLPTDYAPEFLSEGKYVTFFIPELSEEGRSIVQLVDRCVEESKVDATRWKKCVLFTRLKKSSEFVYCGDVSVQCVHEEKASKHLVKVTLKLLYHSFILKSELGKDFQSMVSLQSILFETFRFKKSEQSFKKKGKDKKPALRDLIGDTLLLPPAGTLFGFSQRKCIDAIVNRVPYRSHVSGGVVELENMLVLYISSIYGKYRNKFSNQGENVTYNFKVETVEQIDKHVLKMKEKKMVLFARPRRQDQFIYCGTCSYMETLSYNEEKKMLCTLLNLQEFDIIQSTHDEMNNQSSNGKKNKAFTCFQRLVPPSSTNN